MSVENEVGRFCGGASPSRPEDSAKAPNEAPVVPRRKRRREVAVAAGIRRICMWGKGLSVRTPNVKSLMIGTFIGMKEAIAAACLGRFCRYRIDTWSSSAADRILNSIAYMLVYILTYPKLRLRRWEAAGYVVDKTFFLLKLHEILTISTGPTTVYFRERLWNEDCTSGVPKVDDSVQVVMGMDYGISHRFLAYQ